MSLYPELLYGKKYQGIQVSSCDSEEVASMEDKRGMWISVFLMCRVGQEDKDKFEKLLVLPSYVLIL